MGLYRVMRTPILSVVAAACLFDAACTSVATQSSSIAERVAAQNALFEEWYQADLKAHPEQATEYGDYRYNDRLNDRSLAALSVEHASDQDFIARLSAIPATGFSEQDAILTCWNPGPMVGSGDRRRLASGVET